MAAKKTAKKQAPTKAPKARKVRVTIVVETVAGLRAMRNARDWTVEIEGSPHLVDVIRVEHAEAI